MRRILKHLNSIFHLRSTTKSRISRKTEFCGLQTAFVYTLNALANEVTYYVKTFEQSGTFVILINIFDGTFIWNRWKASKTIVFELLRAQRQDSVNVAIHSLRRPVSCILMSGVEQINNTLNSQVRFRPEQSTTDISVAKNYI